MGVRTNDPELLSFYLFPTLVDMHHHTVVLVPEALAEADENELHDAARS